MAETYRPNDGEIAAETIDGEVVIVHFSSGNYYALNGLAADIWQWLEQGHPVSTIVGHILTEHGEADADAIGAFILRLRDEGLLETADHPEPGADPLSTVAVDGPYADPQLEKYEDMQQLILLDPIHEVGEAGWPQNG